MFPKNGNYSVCCRNLYRKRKRVLSFLGRKAGRKGGREEGEGRKGKKGRPLRAQTKQNCYLFVLALLEEVFVSDNIY